MSTNWFYPDAPNSQSDIRFDIRFIEAREHLELAARYEKFRSFKAAVLEYKRARELIKHVPDIRGYRKTVLDIQEGLIWCHEKNGDLDAVAFESSILSAFRKRHRI